MKLQYTRTVEDYVAFSRLLSKRSVQVRKRRLVLVSFLCLGFFLMLWGAWQNVPIALCLSLLGALAFYFWLPLLGQNATRSAVKKSQNALGDSDIAIQPDGLVGRRGHHEIKTDWDGIGEIVVDGEHTFIYIDTDTAHIIPHRRITGGNYALFMQELARQVEAHTLAPLNDLTVVAPVAGGQVTETTVLQARVSEK